MEMYCSWQIAALYITGLTVALAEQCRDLKCVTYLQPENEDESSDVIGNFVEFLIVMHC